MRDSGLLGCFSKSKATWLGLPLDVCLWIALGLTIYSGGTYVLRALRLARE